MKRLKYLVLALIVTLVRNITSAAPTEQYNFTGLNVPVPDGNGSGMSDVRTLSSSIRSITGLRVTLNIAGEFNGDLYGYLRHVQGGTTNFCVLLNRPGRTLANPAGYADSGLNVAFDDAALAGNIHLYGTVSNVAPGQPLTGSWQPDGRKVDPTVVLDTSPVTTTLSGFNGADGSGTWTLFLADMVSGGTNMLVSWGLQITGVATPPLTWATPADIVYGTALGAAQLNASSTVAGTFSYSPPAGTVLNAGAGQTLTATFTPTDLVNYVSASTNVTINVLKAGLVVTAANTNKIYGAPLPALTASYSGFVNGDNTGRLTTPAVVTTTATASSPVGNYPITASGGVASNYTFAYVAGTLTINKASTAGLVSSSANPSLPGAPVIFTLALTVGAPGAGTPTGNVHFTIDGADAGTTALSGAGAATITNSTLSVGRHSVVAGYAGDSNFIGTTNSLGSQQLVNSPPVAGTDTIDRYPIGGAKTRIVDLLTNDFDTDGDAVTFVSAGPLSVNGGQVTQSGGWIFYAPAAGFTNTDSFTYTISDTFGATAAGTVLVNIKSNTLPSPNLIIVNLGNGSYLIGFDGIPGVTYAIQYADSAQNPVWLPLGSATADAFGSFQFIDTPPPASPQRLYRSVLTP